MSGTYRERIDISEANIGKKIKNKPLKQETMYNIENEEAGQDESRDQQLIRTIKIKGVELSQNEVEQIVSEWYTNGMYADILQDENGLDLEEILSIDYSVEIETKMYLDNKNVTP